MNDGTKAVLADNGDEAADYIAARAAKAGRACGSCSLCCKVLDVPDLAKPEGKWCKHCKPGHGGCTIYDNRPDVCKGFACLWLINDFWGEEWKPTRCKMVLREHPFENHIVLYVNVDQAYPDAWRKSPYYEQLKIYTSLWPERPVCISIGARRIAMVPDMEVELQPGESVSVPWTLPDTVSPEQKKQFLTMMARARSSQTLS
jgi:hypothetical protein